MFYINNLSICRSICELQCHLLLSNTIFTKKKQLRRGTISERHFYSEDENLETFRKGYSNMYSNVDDAIQLKY
jgi:hypothetical protein